MKTKLTAFALLFAAAFLLYSQSSNSVKPSADAQRDIESTFQKMEHQWADAVKRRDVETISRLQADDFEFTGPSGEPWPKARALEYIKAGNLEISSFEMSEFKVRVYGDTAVVNFRVVWNATAGGNDMSGPQRMTDVFIKRDGRWQCVASQTTRIQTQ